MKILGQRLSIGSQTKGGVPSRKRILFMPTTFSLAHVGRLVSLASTLRAEEFESVFALDEHSHRFLPSEIRVFSVSCTRI